MDYRDMALEVYGDENAELRARVADLESDLEWCREIISAGIRALNLKTCQYERLREAYHRTLAELRSLRPSDRRAA